MSDLQGFLRAAQTGTEEQLFQWAHGQGLIPPEELIGRVRLVGDPRSPSAVPYQFRTVQDWVDDYGNREVDYERKVDPLPPLP